MPIKHAFVSGKADGEDPTLLQPSHWDADHVGDAGTLADPGAVWAATTAYSVGNRVKDTATVVGEAGVAVFECIVAGTSGGSNPFGWYPGYYPDGTVAWLYIGYIGGIDARLAAPPVAYAHDGNAYAGPYAGADGTGNAYAGPFAETYGAGHAYARPFAEAYGAGNAYAGPYAGADGNGNAYAGPYAETHGAGHAYAGPSARAYGDGSADALSPARVDGTGTATAKIHAEYSTTKDAYVEVQATSAGANLAIHDGTSTGPGVLTSDGTHATWEAAAGGGALVLLEQHTAADSATLGFTTCISAAYDEYLIELVGIVPATNGAVLLFRCSTNGGSTYDASAIYDWGELHTLWSGGATSLGADGAVAISLFSDGAGTGLSSTATSPMVGSFRLFDPASTASYKMILGSGFGVYSATDGRYQFSTTAQYRSLTAVNAFQFLFSSGNIASGTIRVYGLAKS
jgi:hypothetical protein